MKKIKSLTLLAASVMVAACGLFATSAHAATNFNTNDYALELGYRLDNYPADGGDEATNAHGVNFDFAALFNVYNTDSVSFKVGPYFNPSVAFTKIEGSVFTVSDTGLGVATRAYFATSPDLAPFVGLRLGADINVIHADEDTQAHYGLKANLEAGLRYCNFTFSVRYGFNNLWEKGYKAHYSGDDYNGGYYYERTTVSKHFNDVSVNIGYAF